MLWSRLPAPTRLTCLAPVPGDTEMLSLREWTSMGALFPPCPEQNQGGTGQTLGMSPVPHRLALSSSSPARPALLPGWPPALFTPPRPQTLHCPLLRLLHDLGQCSCHRGAVRAGLGQFCRSKLSPLHDTALRSWASAQVGPALPAQLVWLWHPCRGGTHPALALDLAPPFHVPANVVPAQH